MAKLKISQVQLWSKNTRLLTVAQNRFQKRTLHEHHIKRKRCRLLRRQDIIDAFWNVYEQEAFNRLNELINDLDVANEQYIDTCLTPFCPWIKPKSSSYGVKNVCSSLLKLNSTKWSHFMTAGYKVNLKRKGTSQK